MGYFVTICLIYYDIYVAFLGQATPHFRSPQFHATRLHETGETVLTQGDAINHQKISVRLKPVTTLMAVF